MGHSQAEKAASRERILTEAAAQIREGGLESVSVAALMKSAGLTHGGFYGHFASRSDLLAQALRHALVEGEAKARSTQAQDRPRRFGDVVRSYLSRPHRDGRKTGCAISALASDVARADDGSRAVMSEHMDAIVERLQRMLGDDDDARATLAFSTMVGAVSLARVELDPERSDRILRTARDYLLAMEAAR